MSNGTGQKTWTKRTGCRIQVHVIRQLRKTKASRMGYSRVGIENRGKMKNKDSKRKWMWWFLGVVVALQLYFVRELLAAFAIFAVGFAAIALVVMSLYMLQKVWETGVQRVADSQNPVVNMARRGVNSVEDLVRRPLRRPGSAAAR